MRKTYSLDTNVYGELLIEENGPELVQSIKEDKAVFVYGVDIIENELKASPADIKFKGGLLRAAVLAIYNSIIDEELELFPLAKHLASKYFEKFDELRKSGRYYMLIDSKKRYDAG